MDELIEREARLFEAGNYEDKGMEITEGDLDVMATNFAPVPVKVEHTDTPFDGSLGMLQSVYRKGKELWGKIGFQPAAWALAKAAGALKLSLAIKKDKTAIGEVSLVREPRVAGAQVFNGDAVMFSGDFDAGAAPEQSNTPDNTAPVKEPETEVRTMSAETNTQQDAPPTMDLATAMKVLRDNVQNPDAAALFKANQDILELVKTSDEEVRRAAESARAVQAEMQKMTANHLVEKFRREGKITPAAEVFARAILSAKPLASAALEPDQMVKFSVEEDGKQVEQSVHYADAFVKFLETMVPSVRFSEMPNADGVPELTPGSKEWARKLGVTDEALIKYNRGGVS